MSILKFPKKLKPVKNLLEIIKRAGTKTVEHGERAIAANSRARGLKSVANTFSHNRKMINKRLSPYQVSPKTIAKAMVKDIGTDGAMTSLFSLKLVQAGAIRKALKIRKTSGKAAAKTIRELDVVMGKRSNIDRIVNARAKGITFRRIGGRIRPIRLKK